MNSKKYRYGRICTELSNHMPQTYKINHDKNFFTSSDHRHQNHGKNHGWRYSPKINLYLHGTKMERHIQSSLQKGNKSIKITYCKAIEVAISKTYTLTRISRKKIINRQWTNNFFMNKGSKERSTIFLRYRKSEKIFEQIYQ